MFLTDCYYGVKVFEWLIFLGIALIIFLYFLVQKIAPDLKKYVESMRWRGEAIA